MQFLVCCSDSTTESIKQAVGGIVGSAGKFIINKTGRKIINKNVLVAGIGGVLLGFTVGVFLCGRSGHTMVRVNNNTIVHNHYTHN